jgi:hypothetical protein
LKYAHQITSLKQAMLRLLTMNNLIRSTRSIAAGFIIISIVCADAAVFVVTDTSDAIRVSSLRGAVIAANRNGGNNTIILGLPSKERRNQQQRPVIYRLTVAGADEDAARTGDLDITRGNLTIISINSNVTIDATGLGDRVFQVFSNAHLTLSGLTIKGGSTPEYFYDPLGGFYGEPGGAIFNSGTLTVQNCNFVGNTCGNGGNGGGLYNRGSANLDNCIVMSNFAGAGYGPNNFGSGNPGGNGGGICNVGNMILTRCTISNNAAGQGGLGGFPSSGIVPVNAPGGPGGNGGDGGGIWNTGDLKLSLCTVNGNASGDGGSGGNGGSAGGNGGAGGNGAGIFSGGNLNLNTCTISGNSSGMGGTGGDGWFEAGGIGGDGGNGGGIYTEGTFSMTSSTIALNEAGVGGNGGNSQYAASAAIGGMGGDCGGVLNDASKTNIVSRNTLVALNTPNVGGMGGTNFDNSGETTGSGGSNGFGFDIVGDFTSRGFNLIGMADGGTGFTNGLIADQVGSNASPINPLLGPLQTNGSLTPTHALLWGSPAIDKGNCFGIHTDQRGHHRPHDYPLIPNAIGGDGSDIGAFELDKP